MGRLQITPVCVVSVTCSAIINSSDPVIEGADIIAQTKVEMTPGQPLTYRWEGHGFEVHIPAGAILAESGPVTMSIQASFSGEYQLPEDGVLVSGVYWVALHPPVKFTKNVGVGIQHCGSVEEADSALFLSQPCAHSSHGRSSSSHCQEDSFYTLTVATLKSTIFLLSQYLVGGSPSMLFAPTTFPSHSIFVKCTSL